MRVRAPNFRLSMLRIQQRYGSFAPFLLALANLLIIFFGAILGYMYLEGWNYLDSFYMVVITLATVGFQEVHPLSDHGRLFTSFLILFGVGNFAFLVGSFTQILVEGRLQTIWGRRRVQRTIDKLKNHIVVCGFGRIGSIAVREIIREGLPVVVIEKNPALVEKMEEKEILYVSGDATADEVLERAGLMRAKSLIAALSNEAANVYVCLIARQLRPDLRIVARADSEEHIPRLERAGADRVLMPHILGGVRMAQSVVKPTITSFLEMGLTERGMDLQMEELEITERSELAGKNLMESKIRPRFNLIVIGIKKATGEMHFNPGADSVLAAGDTIIVVGSQDNLADLWEIA
jgi:voltage-gated potassium channel